MHSFTDEQIDAALEWILEGKDMSYVWTALGFKKKTEFARFCKNNPGFREKIEEAKRDSCWMILEDEMKGAYRSSDPKKGKIKLDGLVKLLAYLDPKKYGNKIEMNVNENISVRVNLDSANDRIKGLIRDVNPIPLSQTPKE